MWHQSRARIHVEFLRARNGCVEDAVPPSDSDDQDVLDEERVDMDMDPTSINGPETRHESQHKQNDGVTRRERGTKEDWTEEPREVAGTRPPGRVTSASLS